MNIFIYKYRRFFIAFGCFLIHISLGNYYAFGNIQNDVVQFVFNYSNTCVNLQGHWVFGTIVIGMGSSMSLGGFLETKIGSSLTVLFGGLLLSLMISLMYVTLHKIMPVIIVTYGLIGGIGTGIAYGVALGVSLKNFPRNKGLILGIAVSGFGLSAFIFELIQGAFIKKQPLKNLPDSFIYLSIIVSGIQIVGSLLINEKLYEKINMIIGHNDNENSDSNQSIIINDSNNFEEKLELRPHQIIWELDFWILWIILLLDSFSLTVFTSLSRRYWDAYQNTPCTQTDSEFQHISSIGAVFNCFGRIFWGFLIDKIRFRIVNFIISFCIAIFIGTFALITLIQNTSVFPFIFGIYYSIIYFILSAILSIFPKMCATLFGTKYFTSNYGMLFTSISVSATITSLINTSFDKHDTSKLRIIFIITGLISLLSALLTLVFRGKSLISHSN